MAFLRLWYLHVARYARFRLIQGIHLTWGLTIIKYGERVTAYGKWLKWPNKMERNNIKNRRKHRKNNEGNMG